MKDDLIAVLAAVSRATGIPEEHIFSKRRGQEYYDARWLAVELLHEKGYYPRTIADWTGMTHRNVCKIIVAVRDKDSHTWGLFMRRLEQLRNAIGTQA